MFEIRYISLEFMLVMEKSGKLPKNKVPAIRGGIGNMLLMGNCMEAGTYGKEEALDYHVPEPVCKRCSFRGECLVQRIYYHPYKIQPDFVHEKANAGYLYECSDVRRNFRKGDTLSFRMKLFGDVIIHFPQILQAVYQLGRMGLGNEKLPFSLVSVKNHRDERVLDGNNVCLGYIRPGVLADHIRQRMAGQEAKEQLRIYFETPWTQKYQGKFLQEFHADAFVDAVYRRVFLMHCLEGIGMERQHRFQKCMRVSGQRAGKKEVQRYSQTQAQKIHLNGLLGEFILENVPEEFLPFLYAGEFLHIGKNCSMGFGKYRVL